MGNHDEREHYARELFGEEVLDEATQDRVHDVDGLRIIALDTSVPGYHHGELRPSSWSGCASSCAKPAPHGTLSRCTTRRSRCR